MTAATPSLELLSVDHLKPSAQNPRRIDDKHPSLPGLADSLKAQGMLEPILVRPIAGHWFEILAGERRWRAARLAGMTEVPCLVREVDDTKAFEITVTENLQREDLHWLEEARGVEMMVKKGWEAEAIAKQLGKSPSWVALRAKLATISKKWQEAVEDPKGHIHRWPVAWLELVARLPVATQDEILKEDRWDLQSMESAADLRQHIDRGYLRLLNSAPWDLNEGRLVTKAGACVSCPKRTSCQQDLFQDEKGGDRCLDAACWASKDAAFRKVSIESLKAQHPEAKLVSSHYSAPKGTLGSRDYDTATAKTKGAVETIVIDHDTKVPHLVHIVTGKNRTGNGARYDSAPSKAKAKDAKPTPPKERLAEFMKRRKRAQVKAVIAQLGGDPDESPYQVRYRTKWKPMAEGLELPDLQTLAAIGIAMGIEESGQGQWKEVARRQGLSQLLFLREAWDAIRPGVIKRLAWDADDCEIGGAQFIAKICNIDWNSLVADVQDKLPLPRTLAEHFEENGQPVGKALEPKKLKKAQQARA